ncbi:MAG: hypothetical protein IKX35_00045 [Bacteroidales bacterium]|nr:hypothetical protein [Bacteroidales bacterium]
MKTNEIISVFQGIGIIIDENINNPSSHDNILKIHKYFIRKQIPILTYEVLPKDETVQNFKNTNFIVLDWNLKNLNPIPQSMIDENIHFIEIVNANCFVPIFIFTNENPRDIELELERKGLFSEDKNNNIFVKSKSEIKSGKVLFSAIAKWVQQVPSVYVMKLWEKNTQNATASLFHDLNKISSDWISVMMDTYLEDVGTENAEIGNLLLNNLTSTCAPLLLDKSIVHKTRKGITKEELRKLLEREKYIKNDRLLPYPVFGDIYKEGKIYYFNFRADCDLVRQDNPEMYLVKGKVLKESELKKRNSRHKFYKGSFIDTVDSSVVPFIDDGKIIVFEFKKLRCMFWKDCENKRIGRLLPPYSIRLKSQLMTYLQRQALPSIPEKALKG